MTSLLLIVSVVIACASALGWLAWQQNRTRLASAGERMAALEERCAAQQAALDRADADRRDTEAALQASEQRYALALRGSQDGLWEWDIAADTVLASPRWKGMLGMPAEAGPEPRAAFLAHVHGPDRPGLEKALADHLADSASRFEHEFRLVHADGRMRWVLSRGVAIRRAGGAAYRMVGLDTDVTRVKRVQTVLDAVVEGTSGVHGEQFFPALVQHFARALEVDCAFVTECADHPPTRLRTLAFWSAGELRENFEYALSGTPCEAVVNGRETCFHRDDLAARFPKEAGFESYLGMPIIASDGRVLGHLAFLDTTPLGDEMLVESVYRIFVARAAAEIERMQAVARLRLH